MAQAPALDLSVPRSVGEIIDLVVVLHRRHLLLFLALSLSVVAVYTLIVLAVTGTTSVSDTGASTETVLLLGVISFALVGPLISVLVVHALIVLAQGRRPSLGEIYRPALRVLPVATAAQLVAGLAIGLGLVLFVIPGILIAIRLAVVAQVAAVDRTDWIGALRGSLALTAGRGWHVLGALVVSGVVDLLLGEAAGAAATHASLGAQVALAIVAGTIGQSFAAVVAAVLLFDLRARSGEPVPTADG